MKKILAGIFLLGSLLFYVHSIRAADSLVIVANPAIPIQSISSADLEAIFLKKKSFWSGQLSIRPIDWQEGTIARKLFLQKILGRSESDVAQYWMGQKLQTGKSAPLQLESTTAICDLVASLEGAIGYILATEQANCAQVKIINLK